MSSSSYDLLHGTKQSVHLVHYGTQGMRWGVINEDKSSGSSSGPTAAQRKERAAGGAAIYKQQTATRKAAEAATAKSTGASLNKSAEATLAEAKTPEAIYSAAFTAALGDPPITAAKIAAATKAAEKAVEDAEGEDGGKGKGEEEKKGGGPKEEPKKKEDSPEEKRARIAAERTAASELGKEIAAGMLGGKKRDAEALKDEAEGIVKMLKMVAHDKDAYDTLQSIGSRSLSESKGAKARSPEQLKTDAAFVKKMSDRFAEEADFIGNFGKEKKMALKDSSPEEKREKDKVKHSAESDEYLKHYGTKGMRWGVRKTKAEAKKARAQAKSLDKKAALGKKRVSEYIKSAGSKTSDFMNTPKGRAYVLAGAAVVTMIANYSAVKKSMALPVSGRSALLPTPIKAPTIDWSKFPEAAKRR